MKIFTLSTSGNIITKTAELVKSVLNSGKKCVVFSEDKINLSLELEIARALGGGFFDVDVYTFRRYVHAVSPSDKILSQQSSVMLIRKILTELKDNLSCFKSSAGGPNMALTLYELISQLKSAKVSPENLLKLIEGTSLADGALRSKLTDVHYVYDRYCQSVEKSGFYDRNDYLSLMPQTVKSDINVKNSVVILSGFSSVTKQRFDVFRALYDTALDLYAVVPYHKTGGVYTGETYKRLLEIDASATVEHETPTFNECELLRKYLFSPEVLKGDFKPFNTDKISLYKAYDTAEEIDFIAKDIISEVRLSGNRYKDLAIAVGSLDETLPYIKRAFKDYEIPFYFEKQTSLLEHPLSSLILAFLDFARKGIQVKEFIKIVGNTTFIPDKQIADGLITAVYKNSISRFVIRKQFEFTSENLAVYEDYRKKAVFVAEQLSKCKTVKDFTTVLKNTLTMLGVKENLELLSKELIGLGELVTAQFNDGALLKVYSVLEEMENVLGESKITALDFKRVIQSGLDATKVGLIPILNDAVYVGEIKDIKFKGAKVLYCASLSGDVPFTKADTSLLTDSDLSVLDGFDVIVEPKIKVVNDRERENVLMTLTSFKDKLKLSYSLVNSLQNAVHKSELIKSITKIFNLHALTKQEIDDGIKEGLLEYKKYEVGAFSSKQTALRQIAWLYSGYKTGAKSALNKVASFYEALNDLNEYELTLKANELLTDKVSEEYIDTTYVQNLSQGEISATTLETFFSCPYKSYASHVLRLQETETGEVRANETGTMLHSVLELYVKQLSKVSDKLSSDALVESIFAELLTLPDYAKYLSENPVLEFQLQRTKKEAKRVCFEVFTNQLKTKFIPTYFEKRFGKGQEFPAITLHPNSGDIGVRGMVDRVDYYGDNVRVIDYKTGAIDSSSEAFYTGNKLQLYLYMNAFTADGKRPAGAYYYSVKDDFAKSEGAPVMEGNTLLDSDVIVATDEDINLNKKSSMVKVALKNDGGVYSKSSTLTEDEFLKHLEYSKLVSEKCVDEMRTGFITPTPYEGACAYCKYGAMCGFSCLEGGVERKENGVDKTTIVNAVDKENELIGWKDAEN